MATTKSPEEIEQRRLRRAERREAQRRTNLARAAKMHDIRIKSTNNAAEHSTTLEKAVNIGCSGWYYWHWKGQFYPEGAERNAWFSIYQDHFDTVELNAPFYNWPTVATVRTWLRQSREDFVYTVKVSELITHIKRFDDTNDLVKDFGVIADTLGPRMGCLLFQLPPSIKYDPMLLDTILGQLEPRHRNVVEFRHKSWWNDDVFAAFESAGTIFCSTSGPRLPDQLVKTADDIYVRFHGVEQWYLHDYSQGELEVWADRIHQSGAKRVWAYFNNDRSAHAIKNAQMLNGMLGGFR